MFIILALSYGSVSRSVLIPQSARGNVKSIYHQDKKTTTSIALDNPFPIPAGVVAFEIDGDEVANVIKDQSTQFLKGYIKDTDKPESFIEAVKTLDKSKLFDATKLPKKEAESNGKAEAIAKAKEVLAEAQKAVAEAEKALKEAEAKKDADAIAKAKEALAEAQKAVAEAEKALKEAEAK